MNNKTFSYKNNLNNKSVSVESVNSTKKIIINKKSDLINIPIQQLRTAQLKNFSGLLFEQIYKEAIEIEHNQKNINIMKKNYSEEIDNYLENKNRMIKIINKRNKEQKENKIEIKTIKFEIKYDTKYGEEIGILGSNNIFGNWNINNIFFLKWNDGNIWNGIININQPYINFEFKFVVTFNRKIKFWENGNNNIINFESLLNEIKHKTNGYLNKCEYNYDNINKELYLKCKWN